MDDEAVRLDRDGRQVASRTSAGIGGSVLVVDVTGQEVHDLLFVVLAEMLRIVKILVMDTALADEHHGTALVDLVGTCACPGVVLGIIEQNGAIGIGDEVLANVHHPRVVVSVIEPEILCE